MTSARAFSCAALLALLAGCASPPIRDLVLEDQHASRVEAARRAGIDAATADPTDRARVAARVRALLSGPLTEEQAVAVALVNDREILAAYARLGIARAEVVQAGLFTNPVVSGNAKRFSKGTEIEASLVTSALDAFLRPLRVRVAEAQFQAERTRLTRELVRAAYETRRAYAEVVVAEELVTLRGAAVESAEGARRLMKRLFDAGNVTGLAMAREDAAVGRARLDLHAAESAEREARERLNARMGAWGELTAWTAAPDARRVPPPDLDRIESRAVQASLDLAAERAAVEAVAQMAGLVEWQGVIPALDVGAAAKREAGDGWGVGPDVALELPLFDRGQARNAAARAELDARLAEFEETAVHVRRAARVFRDRVLTLRERERYLRESFLDARRRVVHETLLVYNAMQVGAFDVLLARRLEIDAQREHIATRHALRLAELDVEELLAGRLDVERAGEFHVPEGSSAESPESGAGEEH